MHGINVAPDTVAHELYGDTHRVNTFHHQAVDRLGDGLVATATAEDGTIEAVEVEGAPIIAVQWHPECFGGDPIFDWLIDQARSHLSVVAAHAASRSGIISTIPHHEQEFTHVTAP